MTTDKLLLTDEGAVYDADCGQEICCDILPKYLSGQKLEDCYIEISNVIKTFVDERLEAQLAKVLKHRLDRPGREKIAKHLWRQRTPDKILRQGADWKYLTETTQAGFLEEADQILALIPSEEEIRKQQQVEDTAYYAEMMKVATDRVGKEARRDEKRRMLDIIREYGLDTVSARDDVLERQAKGWQVLKEE